MERRKWDAKMKAKAAIEFMQGQSAAEICTKYGIHQQQLYKWREELVGNAHRVFEMKKASKKERGLAEENRELKSIIGELTVELKKTEEGVY